MKLKLFYKSIYLISFLIFVSAEETFVVQKNEYNVTNPLSETILTTSTYQAPTIITKYTEPNKPSIIVAKNRKGQCVGVEKIIKNSYITKCEVNNSNKIRMLTLEISTSQSVIESIGKFKSLEELHLTISQADYDKNYYYNFDALKKLKNLTFLSLNLKDFGTSLYGIIESGILAKFKYLKKLELNGIMIEKHNIDDIATLTKLEELYIDDCILSYFSFDTLKELKNLKVLEIIAANESDRSMAEIKNGILNEVSSDIKNFKKLEKLIINDHEIKTIPNELSELKKLEYLDLSNNGITLEINQLNGLKKNLKYLSLFKNTINGELDSLKEFKKLEHLDLSYITLNTTIPKSLKKLSKLKYVDFSNINNSIENSIEDDSFMIEDPFN